MPVITDYEIWKNNPEKVFGITKEFADKNPNTTARLVKAMIRAAKWLDANGMRAPYILAEDATRGLVLLEDFGDDLVGAGQHSALMQLRIGGPDNRAFDRAGDDLGMTVGQGRVVEDAIDRQRPVLHQALHGVSLPALGEPYMIDANTGISPRTSPTVRRESAPLCRNHGR